MGGAGQTPGYDLVSSPGYALVATSRAPLRKPQESTKSSVLNSMSHNRPAGTPRSATEAPKTSKSQQDLSGNDVRRTHRKSQLPGGFKPLKSCSCAGEVMLVTIRGKFQTSAQSSSKLWKRHPNRQNISPKKERKKPLETFTPKLRKQSPRPPNIDAREATQKQMRNELRHNLGC